MGGNRVKFPLLICTADKSATAQPPTAFSTARAHVGLSSACLQKADVVLLSPAPLMPPSWKKSYPRSVARDKSFQPLHRQGCRGGADRAFTGSPSSHGGCTSLSPASCDRGGATSSNQLQVMASDPELTKPLTLSYSHQHHPTKLQSVDGEDGREKIEERPHHMTKSSFHSSSISQVVPVFLGQSQPGQPAGFLVLLWSLCIVAFSRGCEQALQRLQVDGNPDSQTHSITLFF